MATAFAMGRSDNHSEANQYITTAAKKYPNRIIPFARVNPWLENSTEILEKAIREGATGLKPHPGDDLFDPDYKMVHPLFEIAEKARIPVVLHTGGGAKPAMVGLVADRFPRVNFVLLHLSDFPDDVFVARKCENVYRETPQCLYLQRILCQVVDKVGAQKVIRGTTFHFLPGNR